MFQCPQCPQTFPSTFLLNQHIQNFHRGMGWYEGQQTVIGEKGTPELKAIEHQLAAQREKMEKQRPLSSPIPAPLQQKPKEDISIPNGWVRTQIGYEYEHEIFRHHTTENSSIGVLHANLNTHYIKCLLHTYDKNLSEIARLHEKEAVLDGRLQSFVPSDPAFPQIANELHKVKSEINRLTKTLRPDEVHHLIFESISKFEANTNENNKWMSEMMQRVIEEQERLKSNYQRQHESDSK